MGERVQTLVRGYLGGAGVPELARCSGWSASTVRRRLIAAGVVLRTRPQIPTDRQWWVDRVADGATPTTLAQELGIAVRTAAVHLHRWGLTHPAPPPFQEWLRQRVVIDGDCLRWMAGHTSHGYPITPVDGRNVIARRVIWEHHHGPIADGMEVLRSADCRFLDCVALAHLSIGEAAQRVAALVLRAAFVHGEQHWKARLTADQARTIRGSIEPTADLARRFGISRATVNGIQARRRWIHLDDA